MRIRVLILMLAALAAAGCASLHDAGWTGEGAEPFDSAKAACDAETAMRPEGAARTEAFETCMAAKGWRRP